MDRRDDDLLYRKRIIRRSVLVWACIIITMTIMAYMENIGAVNAADATIIVSIIGILSLVIKYQDDSNVG